jgi:hypothetical protein
MIPGRLEKYKSPSVKVIKLFIFVTVEEENKLEHLNLCKPFRPSLIFLSKARGVRLRGYLSGVLFQGKNWNRLEMAWLAK